MFSENRIVVDIGGSGGRAEKLARLDWSKHFYVVDPRAICADHTPGNLHILPQLVSLDSPLPFESGTVHEAYLDFLMGEIMHPGKPNASVEDAIDLYRIVVQEIRRVLTPEAFVYVMDVRCNIDYAKSVFEACGFMTTKPKIIRNRNATAHSAGFFQLYLDSRLYPDESTIIPMEFIADVQ